MHIKISEGEGVEVIHLTPWVGLMTLIFPYYAPPLHGRGGAGIPLMGVLYFLFTLIIVSTHWQDTR